MWYAMIQNCSLCHIHCTCPPLIVAAMSGNFARPLLPKSRTLLDGSTSYAVLDMN